MDELLFGLDGITFQHAAELLLQCGTTATERRRCRQTYIECFEQVVFALLMSDRIALNDNLPRVGKDKPGESLKPFLGRLVVPVRDNAPETWKQELLKSPEFEAKIKSWLSVLEEALLLKRTAWENWIIREVSADYFGTDLEIGSSQTPLTALKFKGEHYIAHHPAQDSTPKKFVHDLTEVVHRTFPRLHVEPARVGEFIERSALTHVVNYWKMNLDIADSQIGDLVRLPHETRASIRLLELDAPETSEADRKRHQVLSCLMPFPMRHLMEDIKDREKVIERLLGLRDLQPIPQIRERLRKVFGELEEGKSEPATKLCNEINGLALVKANNDWRESEYTIGVKFAPDGLTPYASVPSDVLSKLFRTDNYFLRQFTAPDPNYVDKRIKKLFPELA
jgi:hypothetical protein